MVPLVSVAWHRRRQRHRGPSAEFLTSSMRNVVGEGGGALHAIVGTLLITLAAAIISIPIGLFTAIYLVEYGAGAQARARHHLPRRRHDRHPVDRRRSVRLRAVRDLLRPRHPHGHHGLGRAGRADDPRRRPLQRGDAPPRAERAARGVLRARRAEVAHDREGRAAHLDRRHHHRHHAVDLARHRRDRAAAASPPA